LKGDIDNALRLHIYKPSASGEPGEEILDSNIIIVNKNVRKGKYSITFSTMPVVNDSFVFIGLEVTGLNVSLDDSFPNYGPSLEFFESDKPFKSFIRRNHDPMWTPKLLSASSNRYYALNVVMDYY
jgi:hypothetical protein